MKHLKLFEHYKLVLENLTDRESCIKKYGIELFGEQFGNEDNTDLENELLQLIKNFTMGSFGRKMNPNLVTMLQDLSKCLDVYPSVLKPTDTPVYRGTRIYFRDIFGKKIEEDANGLFVSDVVYTSKSPVTSWSTNFSSASSFSQKVERLDILVESTSVIYDDVIFSTEIIENEIIHIDKKTIEQHKYVLDVRIPVVLELDKPQNDFLFDSSKFDRLSEASGEMEVLKITNKPITTKIRFPEVKLSKGERSDGQEVIYVNFPRKDIPVEKSDKKVILAFIPKT